MLVHRRVTPSVKFTGTHLNTSVEKGTAGVKCLTQEHSTMSPAWAPTKTARFEDKRTNQEANAPPWCVTNVKPRPHDCNIQRNISQHCWAQHVARVWPPCCDMLQHIACCWLKFEAGQI